MDCKYCGAKDIHPFYDNKYAENIPSGTQEIKTIGAEKACNKCGAYIGPANRCLEGITVQGKKAVRSKR